MIGIVDASQVVQYRPSFCRRPSKGKVWNPCLQQESRLFRWYCSDNVSDDLCKFATPVLGKVRKVLTVTSSQAIRG